MTVIMIIRSLLNVNSSKKIAAIKIYINCKVIQIARIAGILIKNNSTNTYQLLYNFELKVNCSTWKKTALNCHKYIVGLIFTFI